MKGDIEPGNYVVAVSGGIDSVTLLHMLRQLPDLHLIVAHFDHGIRQDSAEDAAFVRQLAATYGLPFETARVELGPAASEETARRHRYKFLRDIAARYDAHIITAHHADDLVETIAINYVRGTGWRGLAVLDSDIVRPLLALSKEELRDYAQQYGLEWREDSTNASQTYLRNRLRQKLRQLPPDSRQRLLALHARQRLLKRAIDDEVTRLVNELRSETDQSTYDRYFFIHANPKAALAILWHITQQRLTRPQLERLLLAIKTAKHQARYHAGHGIELRFTPRKFTVELIK